LTLAGQQRLKQMSPGDSFKLKRGDDVTVITASLKSRYPVAGVARRLLPCGAVDEWVGQWMLNGTYRTYSGSVAGLDMILEKEQA